MSAPLRDGVETYLLVGSRAACLRAASQAAQEAVLGLGRAKIAFALVLADVAWQLLLESTPGIEVAAVRDIVGTEVPIAGGYTLGQIVPGSSARGVSAAMAQPQFLNQHMVVLAFGEAAG